MSDVVLPGELRKLSSCCAVCGLFVKSQLSHCMPQDSPTLFLSQKLEALDCRVETTLALCTHLVAKQISRTVKFLTCISSCSYIVTPGWIDESFKYNVLLGVCSFEFIAFAPLQLESSDAASQ